METHNAKGFIIGYVRDRGGHPMFWDVGDWSWWSTQEKHGAGDGGFLIKIDLFIYTGIPFINPKTYIQNKQT